ncbi:MAG: hypothetical protein A2143_05885 [Gallionellales bacterium RBG_16_57_15]|nr:MAG: hypothetical protein A2143_05885 [Gallionellales bacterium RBG_16_57_15]
MANGKSEVRFEIPLEDLAVIDAYCLCNNGLSRTSVMSEILLNWTKDKRYEAMMICRVAGINPIRPESDSDRTPTSPESDRSRGL